MAKMTRTGDWQVDSLTAGFVLIVDAPRAAIEGDRDSWRRLLLQRRATPEA